MKFVFFDLETTGLNRDDEVIEIGAIKVVDLEVVSTFKTLVRPRKTISRFITNLTGITQEDLNKAQDRDKIKSDFKQFIEDSILVAHNASFDKEFLERFLEEPLQNEIIDTLELARLIYPELSSHSLEKLVQALNLKKEKAHRAFNDALMLFELFKKLLEESKTFEDADMKLLKEIIGDSRNFGFIFVNHVDAEKTSIKIQKIGEIQTLPFNQVNKSLNKGVFYYEESSLDDIVKLLLSSGRSLIVVYSEKLVENLKDRLNNFRILDATDFESFICIERLNFYLENTKAIPNDLRVDFAIFASYLLKTKDFGLRNAPQHILKNKILRNLSLCKSENCDYFEVCPLKERFREIEKSDFVVLKYPNLFFGLKFLSNFKFDSVFLLEAYRIPKVLSSLKMNFSKEDIEMISNFDASKKSNEVLTLFNNFENLPKNLQNKIISNITNFDEEYSFNRIFRNDSESLSVGFSNATQIFSKISLIGNSINLLSNYFIFKGENYIEKFTGLKGDTFTKDSEDKVMNVIPLFLHAPNADEFAYEFLDLYAQFSDIKPVLFVFENRIQMNSIKMELKNRYTWIEESLLKEDGLIDFVQYEFPIRNRYRLIFIIKLPMNILGSDENYAMYYLKNFIKDSIAYEKSAVLYFDGRLKDRNFVSRFEEAFITTPMLLERKENLVQFVKKHINT
ncbi:3'-5' exonuclease [Caldisericum sp.]|uniref:3'-5' exonuclease n=1 Tax=Caldisericum sp. TaxID=2499687 RepID=UPI003D122032